MVRRIRQGARSKARSAHLPAAASSLLQPYRDPEGRFSLSRPCGWQQVGSLLPGSSVIFSSYNPEEPGAETLAVYQRAAAEGVRQTSDLGSPQDVALGLAQIAPNGRVMEAYELARGGRKYMVVHVEFGGNTAGKFGATREMRAVTVAKGIMYTLRVTTTRYRYLAFKPVQQWMKGAADSFILL
ncbi:hypothetical protein TSOC_006559 [Tetrabaena socialis]|uniref:PsbP C-terminal domain-containing protein n=1 Tax=Tetrabaena socialis TaxID=47790 RepID=A0A2J8A3F7_9CHLO|nr:hypothetical protein TSOC_006559 [Tetrabaena socialis]|eukprot:PNH07050.1 hypothetical protein TSOC_006559 [Tetrabaena socialis]